MNAIDWATLILAVALAGSCVAVSLMATLMAVLTVRWYRSQLSRALEVVIRHQDDAIAYTRKALADATGSGLTRPVGLKADGDRGQNTLAGRAAELMASEAADGQDVV